jgi:transcription elongation factor SPT5
LSNGIKPTSFKTEKSILITDDVNPTLDEITQFTRHPYGGDDHVFNLSDIAEVSRKLPLHGCGPCGSAPGDQIEVFEGEQAGLRDVVDEIKFMAGQRGS